MINENKIKVKECLKHLRLISMMQARTELSSCKYGHFECSYKIGGPCFNELESTYYGLTGKHYGY